MDRVRAEIESLPEILSINDIRSLHFGPRDVLLTLSIDFADDVPSQRIEAIVTDVERQIVNRHAKLTHLGGL